MMRFGLLTESGICLIDMETGEILAETKEGAQKWLESYEGNYTLTLLD